MNPLSRRQVLAGTVGAVAVAATACRDGDENRGSGDDLDAAAAGARMERVAVDTYATLRTSAIQGRLGAAVPQAVVEFLTTAGSHHQEHLNAWNRVLTAGGRAAVDGPDTDLRTAVDRALLRVADIPALVALALRLEDHASRTYLNVIPTLTDPENVRTAGQMLVVDAQHQALLRYVSGVYPVGSGTGRETRDFAPADPGPALLSG